MGAYPEPAGCARRKPAASITKLSIAKVIVNVPLIGGGFGRRLQTDYAQEAVRLSMAINAPVQVLWTRDDDLQHDFYHPMSVQMIRYFNGWREYPLIPPIYGFWILIVPTGAWRSVENFPQAYATQSFIDELAYERKRDPLDLRLELYSDRAAAVIQLAAERAEWGKLLPQGWGHQLAYHATFGVTHVAYVAEVSVDEEGRVRIQRVVAAVDCGQVVNPDNVAAQVESGIAFGLTATLKAEATLKGGRIQQSNFHDYPILQMDEMPSCRSLSCRERQFALGDGRNGCAASIAPAVANAVFAATGKRIRHIPIRPEDLRA